MNDSARSGFDRVAVLLGTFAMTGFFPVAPATVASAVAGLLLSLVYPFHSWLAYGIFCGVVFLVGVWAAGRLEQMYGRDPSAAVIDEVLGMAIALAGMPMTPVTIVFAFLFFRVLDVLKPPPGRALERLPGGWGIMADDACAGVYAAVLLRLLLHFRPGLQLAWWMLWPLAGAALLLVVFRKPLRAKYGKKRCDPRVGMQGDVRP